MPKKDIVGEGLGVEIEIGWGKRVGRIEKSKNNVLPFDFFPLEKLKGNRS